MTVAELKQQIDLADYIRSQGIELLKHGRKDLIGVCPFHDDTTPSLIVTPGKQLWHCMGCDKGGSVIDFVMAATGCTTAAAIKQLSKIRRGGKRESATQSPTTKRGPGSLDAPAGSGAEPRKGTDKNGALPQAPLGSPHVVGVHCGFAASPAPSLCDAARGGEDGAARGQEDCASHLSPERAQQLLERVITLYEKNLAAGESEYLNARGITDRGLIPTHRIGLCKGSLPELLPADGPIHEELRSLGILLSGNVERFDDCVVFPVFDAAGGIVTLYGRHTGGGRKRHVYLPGRPTGLWNVAAARSFHEVILVESVIDGLSVMMAGYQNVISIQGTNGLGDDALQELVSLGMTKVRLLLDGDKSGLEAAKRLQERIPVPCEVCVLPDDHDPNSFLLAEGAEALAAFLSCRSATQSPTTKRGPGTRRSRNASPLRGDAPAGSGAAPRNECASQEDGALPRNRKEKDRNGALPQTPLGSGVTPQTPPLSAPQGNGAARGCDGAAHLAVVCGLRTYRLFGLDKGARKLKATVRLEYAGRLHIDTLDLYSARARQQLCRDLCRIFEQAPETIEGDLTRIVVTAEAHAGRAGAATTDDMADEPTIEISETDREAALTLARDRLLIERILADFERCGLVGEETNKLLCYLAMTSRKMTDPLSVLILSSSGAGKTALQDGALAFCPPEDLVKLTSLSGKALFYKERHSLKHKVLALEEGAGAEDAAYAIRNLISADSLTTESTMRDPQSGKLTTMENTVEGPTAVFVTTTNPEVDAETRSRFLVTGLDESREQTRRILAFQRQRHGPAGLQEDLQLPAILHLHRTLQRLLRPLQVVNPFVGTMSYSDDRLQSRRLQPQYLSLVNAVAFLRQFQKEIKTTGNDCEYIEVDGRDLELANGLAVEILGKTLDELTIPARNLLELLNAMIDECVKQSTGESDPDRPVERSEILFTRREVREFTGWTNTRLHIHLKELIAYEYVILESGRFNSLQHYRLVYDGQGRDGEKFILGLENNDA